MGWGVGGQGKEGVWGRISNPGASGWPTKNTPCAPIDCTVCFICSRDKTVCFIHVFKLVLMRLEVWCLYINFSSVRLLLITWQRWNVVWRSFVTCLWNTEECPNLCCMEQCMETAFVVELLFWRMVEVPRWFTLTYHAGKQNFLIKLGNPSHWCVFRQNMTCF